MIDTYSGELATMDVRSQPGGSGDTRSNSALFSGDYGWCPWHPRNPGRVRQALTDARLARTMTARLDARGGRTSGGRSAV
jgi:hypothetical protein